MKKYSKQFYKGRHDYTLNAAEIILSLILEIIPDIHSVVDIGCGVGSWLYVLNEKGFNDIVGIDGPWVGKENFRISPSLFIEHNLEQPIQLSRKFDLAISLEVAEHLPRNSAGVFIKSITDLADFIVFSAAVPDQGGTRHLNEQWQNYWVKLFVEYGYSPFDVIRPKIWDVENIPFWYKQNIFLFVKNGRKAELELPELELGMPICVIHPDLYNNRVVNPSIIRSLKMVLRSTKKFFFKQFRI